MAATKHYVSTITNSLAPKTGEYIKSTHIHCDDDCLVQPNFFCGQLLSDEDLGALLLWVKGKFKLDRHKHGWGVVHGLQVKCDPDNTNSLLLSPGYAIDQNGEDVIVCEQSTIDLEKACRMPAHKCEEHEYSSSSMTMFLDLPISDGKIDVVDLYLKYQEEKTDPQPALGKKSCSERDACEFSRIKETYKVEWEFADVASNQTEQELNDWNSKYFSKSRSVVDCFITHVDLCDGDGRELKVNDVKDWFRNWFADHPLHQFCFIEDAIENLKDDKNNKYSEEEDDGCDDLQEQLAKILFWVVMDCRIAYLSNGCIAHSHDDRIPLARARIQRRDNDARDCHIIHVDNFKPNHRPLESDHWAAPAGKYNLGQHIWQQTKDACFQLHDLNLKTNKEDFPIPSSPQEVQSWLSQEQQNCSLFADMDCLNSRTTNEEFTMLTYGSSSSVLGVKVLGFCKKERDEHGEFDRADIAIDRFSDKVEFAKTETIASTEKSTSKSKKTKNKKS